MTDEKKADQQASPKDLRINDTSGNAQRARLLAYLRQHGSINTFEAIRLSTSCALVPASLSCAPRATTSSPTWAR